MAIDLTAASVIRGSAGPVGVGMSDAPKAVQLWTKVDPALYDAVYRLALETHGGNISAFVRAAVSAHVAALQRRQSVPAR